MSNVEKRKQQPKAVDNDNTLMLGHMLDASSGLDSSSYCWWVEATGPCNTHTFPTNLCDNWVPTMISVSGMNWSLGPRFFFEILKAPNTKILQDNLQQ